MSWSDDDGEKMRSLVDMEKVYSARIGTTAGAASVPAVASAAAVATPVSLAPGSTDAMEIRVLLVDPEYDPFAMSEVRLNDELVRKGIASLKSGTASSSSVGSSPRRATETDDNSSSYALNAVEEIR